jgi:hypothetical protein
MANPSPQPTPTSGVGTAVKLALSASTEALTTIVAAREYSCTLSLSATGHAASTTVTTVIQDVAGTTFTSGNSNTATLKSYNTAQATVSGAVITAVAVGQAVIEVSFPTFDVTPTNDGITNEETDKIYAQILVTVIP